MLEPRRTLNCNGRLVVLDAPLVMGIVNATPDSFYDGGRYNALDAALRKTEQHLREGATFIDVGGMSSRPGAAVVPIETELERVVPLIAAIAERFPEALISVDTVHGRVAETAIEAGAHLVNDISAGKMDKTLLPTVARLCVPYVLMHAQGTPQTMQQNPQYQNVVPEVLDFMIHQTLALKAMGIYDLIVDVGFGFGKTVQHNYALLNQLSAFKVLGLPILVGISRKSMIYKPLNTNSEEALNGTSALHMVALQQGADILRVHDALAAAHIIRLWQLLEATPSIDESFFNFFSKKTKKSVS